jgi:peptidyl-prolyl cis-trans isomerase C
MLKTSRLAALLIAGAIISAPAFAQSKTFATVNGQAIPQSVYDAFVAEQKAQGTPDLRNCKTPSRKN